MMHALPYGISPSCFPETTTHGAGLGGTIKRKHFKHRDQLNGLGGGHGHENTRPTWRRLLCRARLLELHPDCIVALAADLQFCSSDTYYAVHRQELTTVLTQ